jgi:hypothetical protein
MSPLQPIRADRLCILITVYHPYRWTAPFTWQMIQKFWPGHPPVYFCGLTSEEAGDLPHIPVKDSALPRVWADFAFDAAAKLRADGFEAVYFFLEDHMPLDHCHVENLRELLPSLLNSLPASYIGLMGWDNRRFATRGGKVLPPIRHRLMHLTTARAPRFHLHPSLFRMDALFACLEALRKHTKPNPWGFEKLCDKLDAPLPGEFKAACYQICGSELALRKPGVGKRLSDRLERWVFHRAMWMVPLAYRIGRGTQLAKAIGFDNFFYQGPFPMFFSGVMAAGRVNPFFLRYLRKREDPVFHALIEAAQERAAG